jgi:peptidoglycan/xylan/chitin deacetylase (PgdA/CDA1 family)
MTHSPSRITDPVAAHVLTVTLSPRVTQDASASVSWPTPVSRLDQPEVEVALRAVLAASAGAGATVTLFASGALAERAPGLLKEVAAAGHEIAACGWHGRPLALTAIAPFREDVRRAKGVLEAVTGAPVVGFRAPGIFRQAREMWPIDVLLEEGFRYDSSRTTSFGVGAGRRLAPPSAPFLIRRPSGELLALPLATGRFLGVRLPLGQGPWWWRLPEASISRLLDQQARRGSAAVLELAIGDLPLRGSGALGRIAQRLQRLMEGRRFASAAERYRDLWLPSAPWALPLA